MATQNTNMKPAMTQNSGQFSTFLVGDLFFGVDVLHVQEVLRAQQMTPVPQAPDVIEGLINLRGQIVTAIDMRRRLLMPRLGGDHSPMNMVVTTADGAVSLLVDEIGDVLDLDASAYERPPDNLDPTARELISGVYKMKDGLLLVLDTEKAVEVSHCHVSVNTQFDAQPANAAAPGKRPFSSAPAVVAADLPEPVQAQSSTKKGSRKAAARKANGTARGVEAAPE